MGTDGVFTTNGTLSMSIEGGSLVLSGGSFNSESGILADNELFRWGGNGAGQLGIESGDTCMVEENPADCSRAPLRVVLRDP